MKKYFLILILISSGYSSYSQYLTQSAEGKSSIPLPLNGLGVSIDIGKSEVALGLNNYSRVLKDSAKFLLGLNLSAKNTEGLANLFSSGDIVPQGDFLGFAGFSVSNNNQLLSNYKNSDFYRFRMKTEEAQANLFKDLKQKTVQAITEASLFIKKSAERRKTVKEMTDKVNSILEIISLRLYIKEYKKDDSLLKRFKEDLEKRFLKADMYYTDEFNKTRTEETSPTAPDFKGFMRTQFPVRLTTFLQGGINARGFTRFLKLSTPDFSKSFQDTLYRGGIFGIGFNLQVRNYWLGITYSYLKGDNFANLKSKTYTLRTTDTAANQTLLREKQITAYSGKYSRVVTNQLNIDLVGEFNLSDTSKLLANLYLRGSLHSRDTSYLKNYTNIGAGLYFINKKGKFLGGLYVELPDINNNFEKAKPEEEINIRPPLRKLSIGIVTKFNLSSIFGWSNRPAKPD